jgi:hypothetical protein
MREQKRNAVQCVERNLASVHRFDAVAVHAVTQSPGNQLERALDSGGRRGALMREMQIDLRQPLLVISGRWNPHIFTMDWVAQNLFEVAAGTAVEIGQAFLPDRPSPVLIMNGVGLWCAAERLEFYSAELTPAAFAATEAAAVKALNLLQHTPVFAFGTNFQFLDPDISPTIGDAITTREDLEAKFRVIDRTYKTALQFKGATLNLVRHVAADSVQVLLNFHHPLLGALAVRDALAGSLSRSLQHAEEFMREVYGLEDFEAVAFGTPPKREEDAEA